MKVAVIVWNGRIAPVFDCARTAMLFDTRNGELGMPVVLDLNHGDIKYKAEKIKERGAEELICGAISCEAERLVLNQGLRLHAFIAGETETVIKAWMGNGLDREEYSMPGCSFEHRRRNREHEGRGRDGRGPHCHGTSNKPPRE